MKLSHSVASKAAPTRRKHPSLILQLAVALVVIWQVTQGFFLKEVGIPGFWTLRFAQARNQAGDNTQTSEGSRDVTQTMSSQRNSRQNSTDSSHVNQQMSN